MEFFRQSNEQMIRLEPECQINAGGEARIYALPDEDTLVAKVYHEPKPEYGLKLRAMLANPPSDPTAAQGLHSIAWPIDLLQIGDSKGVVAGYLMPRAADTRPLIDYYNPQSRRQSCPLFSYHYLYRTARNMAAVVHASHMRGYVIGDINESNILVTDTAMVTVVDTDSFQVPDPESDQVFHCPVGKVEFTPPELQGKTLQEMRLTPEHDRFGLAVLIFQLLMEGTHPFAGAYTGEDDPPHYEARIAAGHFPYGTREVPYIPLPIAPSIEILPASIMKLFLRCFQDGHLDPQARPDAETWVPALREAEHNLIPCTVNDQHRYGKHLGRCPWCERTSLLGGRDPFPTRESVVTRRHLQPGTSVQSPLPSAFSPMGSFPLSNPTARSGFESAVVPDVFTAPFLSEDTRNLPPPPPPPPVRTATAPRVGSPPREAPRERRVRPVPLVATLVIVVAGVAVFLEYRPVGGNSAVPKVKTPVQKVTTPKTTSRPTSPSTEAPAPVATLKQFNATVIKGDEAHVKAMLLAYPGLVNQKKQEDGYTPLHFAAYYNRAGIAQILLDAGADVDAAGNDGYTPLHLVAQQGAREVGEALLQKGANVDAREKLGWTPLHIAAQEGRLQVAQLLIDHAADVNAKENKGLTPLAVAIKANKPALIDLLKQSGGSQ